MPQHIYEEPEGRELLPAGEYDFVIAEVFAFERSKKDEEVEYLPIRLNILRPVSGTVFDNLLFTTKAGFRINQLLKSIGKAPAPGTPVDFDDPTWLIGCKGRCRLKVEEYQGKKSNKVEAYVFTPGGVAGRKVMAPAPAPAPAPAKAKAKASSLAAFDEDERSPF